LSDVRSTATIGPFADRLWREKQAAGVAAAAAEKVYLDIQSLRRITICNVRCNRERPSSAMISRKLAFCCL
jgi:hypothetical protein